MSDKTKQLRCNKCGAFVSSTVPLNTVVRGWIQCPECVEEEPSVDALRAENERLSTALRQIGQAAALRSIDSNESLTFDWIAGQVDEALGEVGSDKPTRWPLWW